MAFATKRRRRDGRPTADVFAMRGGASGQMSVGHRVAPRARRLLWAILSLLLHSLPTVVLAAPNDLLVPGSIIALHSTVHNRFVRMTNEWHLDASSEQSWKSLPSDWTWERFRVVDAGNGEIALHSPKHNCFVQMDDKKDIKRSGGINYQDLPSASHWPWARFRVVDAGNGEIALHSPKHNRFVRMNDKKDMDASDHQNYQDLPSASHWPWERFRPVMTMLPVGSFIALHSTVHNRFVRMTNEWHLDASSEQSWKSLPSDWTWERFRVVDAGNGEIALHSPKHNCFVQMDDKKDIKRSGGINYQDLPSASHWPWARFRVVDAGNGEIALHSPKHNRFVRMNDKKDMDASDHQNYQDLPSASHWPWERFRPVYVSPPSPPAPPPSPPPPPGKFKEVTVSMENPVSLISAYSFDFGIRVTHVSCENENDCFESITKEQVERHKTGLRCDAKVKRRGKECSSYGPSLPCREWIDFLPKSLEMTNDQGQIIDGEYDISYSCYFVLPDGSRVHPPQGNEKTLHTFTLRSGCSETMPHGRNQNLENVARQLLLTSDEFNVADCRDETQIYKAKETVFRRYDNDPEDGVLSYDEILSALEAQSADSYVMSLWNEELNGKLELKPTHVMRVETNDMECGTGSIVYDSTVYPSDSPGRESTPQQCHGDATFMQVSWHYNARLTAGDYTCLYADGMLYDKLSVSRSNPNIDGYSEVSGGLYAATNFTDIRPVSGTFEDVQESLIANFLFDGDGSDELISASPRVSGQQGTKPKLLPVGTVRDIKTCTGGNGGLCLSAVASSSVGSNQFGYAYTSDEVFADDMALSTWIYRKCGSASVSDIRRRSIVYFTGKNGGMSHELRFYLESSTTLKLEYARDGSVSSSDSLSLSGLACSTWHYVGFSLNKRDKMVLFANPTGAVDDMSDTSTFKTAQSMDPDTPRKLLSVVKDFEMLGAVDVEFDDVRMYRGQVSRATFLDAYRCGHRPLCAKRAHATPASRRVVCASAVIATKNEETYLDYFCTAAMYYDGAAIDVSAKLDTSGVTFTYRDTSWEESSFEMLRKPVGDEFSSASYETIIQMDGDLKGCVNKFSSISYLDREAGNKPNLEWYYKVRTKMASASSSDLVSTTHYFKAPWIGTLEGTVTAGSSGTPVAHVRVCADFAWPNGTAMSSTVHKSSGDLALYMRTEHSSNMTRTASEKTYVVTDGDPDPTSGASSLNPGEYVRVELARWSSIERVEVCMSGQVSSSQRLRAYVQDYDSGDSGNHGHECTFNANSTISHAQHTCMFYDCVGSKLTSFHGKFINVVRDGESSSGDGSSQIPATGLYSWFKSSEASKEWKSEVNGFVGTVVGGSVKTSSMLGTALRAWCARSRATEMLDSILAPFFLPNGLCARFRGIQDRPRVEFLSVGMETFCTDTMVQARRGILRRMGTISITRNPDRLARHVRHKQRSTCVCGWCQYRHCRSSRRLWKQASRHQLRAKRWLL